jgi:hypothetical protein
MRRAQYTCGMEAYYPTHASPCQGVTPRKACQEFRQIHLETMKINQSTFIFDFICGLLEKIQIRCPKNVSGMVSLPYGRRWASLPHAWQ